MPTIRFIRYINNPFDILNLQNMCQNLWKKPICPENTPSVKWLPVSTAEYIASLTTISREAILATNRKTGFLDFLICIHSIVELCDKVVWASSNTSVLSHMQGKPGPP